MDVIPFIILYSVVDQSRLSRLDFATFEDMMAHEGTSQPISATFVCIRSSEIDMKRFLTKYHSVQRLRFEFIYFDASLFGTPHAISHPNIRQVKFICYAHTSHPFRHAEEWRPNRYLAKTLSYISEAFPRMRKFGFEGEPHKFSFVSALLNIMTADHIEKFRLKTHHEPYADDFIPHIRSCKVLRSVKFRGRSFSHADLFLVRGELHHISDRNYKHNVTLFDMLINFLHMVKRERTAQIEK